MDVSFFGGFTDDRVVSLLRLLVRVALADHRFCVMIYAAAIAAIGSAAAGLRE